MEQNEALKKMIGNGIPVKKAVFHQAISNGFGDNDTNLSSDDPKLARRCEMWLTPGLLVCLQNNKCFASPLANVVYVRF